MSAFYNAAKKQLAFNHFYLRRWPRHCTKCGGWGEWYSPGSYYEPPDGGPCSCVEDGECPRCRKETLVSLDTDFFKPDKDQCSSCGWTTGDRGVESEIYEELGV